MLVERSSPIVHLPGVYGNADIGGSGDPNADFTGQELLQENCAVEPKRVAVTEQRLEGKTSFDSQL